MRKTFLVIFIALALAGFAQEKSAGQDKTAVMATVHQFVDAFNKGDAKTAAAACADETSIIDEFPPYEWHGAGACTKWMNDYDVWAKKNSMSDGAVTLVQQVVKGHGERLMILHAQAAPSPSDAPTQSATTSRTSGVRAGTND
jgi:hypothetical protein